MKLTIWLVVVILLAIISCDDSERIANPCDPDPDGVKDGLGNRQTCWDHWQETDLVSCDPAQCHIRPGEHTCNIDGCHDFTFRDCK